ncbi:PSP1 C-terminal conserved region-domain-containing protein, partial [Mycena alexandri]
LGKGLPLHAVPPEWPLYIVEFKAGRTDLFYRAADRMVRYHPPPADDAIRVGDLVIVEADRGKDLGKVVNDSITLGEVEAFWAGQARFGVHTHADMHFARTGSGGQSPPTSPGGADGGGGGGGKKEIAPKMIYGKAGAGDAQLLVAKMQDELKALALCQTKVRAKKLPMEVVDAEYQWDRRKLTFYFVAEKRIDFRELVRELFRLYKTRIWMASLQGAGGFEQ